MRTQFFELETDSEVISCKECKNGNYYVIFKDITNGMKFDTFSALPYTVGKIHHLQLWKVIDTKFHIKK